MEVTDVRGRFLALEGPDGGGKTTQAARLAESLRRQGRRVVTCRDPGGTGIGDRIRGLLLDREGPEMTLLTEMLLYMASRAQLVEEVIRPALAAGADVVSDRYLLSNVVYQGVAGGLDLNDIWKVGRVATHGLFPDLTIVVDVPPVVGRARTGPARDRIEDRPGPYHDRVREGFLGQMLEYPANIVLVDGDADPDEVARRIEREVSGVLEFPEGS